jgi:hypothetical protein
LDKPDALEVAQRIEIDPVPIVVCPNIEHQGHNISNYPVEATELREQLGIDQTIA